MTPAPSAPLKVLQAATAIIFKPQYFTSWGSLRVKTNYWGFKIRNKVVCKVKNKFLCLKWDKTVVLVK